MLLVTVGAPVATSRAEDLVLLQKGTVGQGSRDPSVGEHQVAGGVVAPAQFGELPASRIQACLASGQSEVEEEVYFPVCVLAHPFLLQLGTDLVERGDNRGRAAVVLVLGDDGQLGVQNGALPRGVDLLHRVAEQSNDAGLAASPGEVAEQQADRLGGGVLVLIHEMVATRLFFSGP